MNEMLERVTKDIPAIDRLLEKLDKIARDEDPHEYGLPMYSGRDSLRLAVIVWVSSLQEVTT